MNSKFRRNRFDLFIDILGIKDQRDVRILDVGGYPFTWNGSGFENVTILNLEFSKDIKTNYTLVEADARNMDMFENQEFDIVFSNSCIEHVGDFESQKRMADEVMRVGRKFWVQTPYKHFPIEIHFLFPFFQYLPNHSRHFIAKTWPFSFPKKFGGDPIKEADHIWLLNFNSFKNYSRNLTS